MTKARANRAALLAKEKQLDIHAIKESNKALKTAPSRTRGSSRSSPRTSGRTAGQVFLAKTGDDAMRYVEELSKRIGAKLIVKSKSLTSDEIEFTHELDKVGIRSVETDLGELIIQLAGETPVHLVMPAAHKSVKEIAELVSKARRQGDTSRGPGHPGGGQGLPAPALPHRRHRGLRGQHRGGRDGLDSHRDERGQRQAGHEPPEGPPRDNRDGEDRPQVGRTPPTS